MPSSQKRFQQSLTRQTLLKIAVRIAVVIIITTVLSYYHTMSILRTQTLEQLQKYVSERTQRERAIFTLAEDNHAVLKKELLNRLLKPVDRTSLVRFDTLFARSRDGVLRNHPERFDGKEQSGVYIDKSLAVDDTLRRNILTFYDLCQSYGPAWHNRFQDTYITTPQNIMVLYWPEVPTWCQDAKADMKMPQEEYVWVADKKHNPQRKTVWTGVFFDKVAKVWMISVETPVDIGGVHIATIGHDMMLNELLDRTVNQRLAGTYNMILRADSRLIAHPQRMEELKAGDAASGEKLMQDPRLARQIKTIQRVHSDVAVLENTENGEYLAVARIPELGWSFVTVYPKSLLVAKAFEATRFILFLGLAALLLELIILYFVLRGQIAVPLLGLIEATESVAAGNLEVHLDTRRRDELGCLATSFQSMAEAVSERDAQLAAQNAALEEQVAARTADLRAANTKLEALATTDPLTGLPNHRALVAILDQELERSRRYHRACSLLFIDLDHFKALNDGCGHAAGDAVLQEAGSVIRKCLRGMDTLGRWGGEEFVVVLPETSAEDALDVAERVRETVAAHLFSVSGGVHLTCSLGVATYPNHSEDRSSLLAQADRAMYAAKRLGRNQMRLVTDPAVNVLENGAEGSREEVALVGMVEALAALVEARDQYTGEHTDGVAHLATQIALSLGLSSTEARMIGMVGKLHDVGKVAIPDAVLQKPGPLNEDEWALMRTHPIVGSDVVSRIPSLRAVAPGIRGHHERWDGSGYPDGLAATDIPLGARIVAAADAYSAMVTDRPYRKACSPELALQELLRCAGTQFDPEVIEALKRVLSASTHEEYPRAA
jgi:diguanylate cyclase (GGDEF)-like protein